MNRVAENFQDPNYRHSLVESYIREGIAFQLKAMRAALTQGDVAEKLGNAKLQPIVSRYENPDYGRYSLATLLKLARIFDVALVVRFEPFSKFMRWHRESATESLAVPSFGEERGAMNGSMSEIANEAHCLMCGSHDRVAKYYVKNDPHDSDEVFTTENSHACTSGWHTCELTDVESLVRR